MRNNFEQELMELKGSFRKALAFCIITNVLMFICLIGEVVSALFSPYGLLVEDGAFLMMAVFMAIWAWFFSCMGFTVAIYRYKTNPSAGILECLMSTTSGKRSGMALNARGFLNAAELAGIIRDLEALAADKAAVTVKAADF